MSYLYIARYQLFPDSVKSIGATSFWYCHSLKEIEIGSGVTFIGMQAFEWCDNLETVKMHSKSFTAQQRIFEFTNGVNIYYDGTFDELTCNDVYIWENKGLHDANIYCLGSNVPITWHLGEHYDSYPPTCDMDGRTEGIYCVVCNKEIGMVPIPALGHNEVPTDDIPPTCSEPGQIGGSHCDRCGCTLSYGIINFNYAEHTIVIDAAVEPTLNSPGLTEGRHCSVCGCVIISQQKIPALLPSHKKGDVTLDFDITIKDLTCLARHVAYIEIITDVNARNNANVNDDEEINIKDLTLLARHVANIELIA